MISKDIEKESIEEKEKDSDNEKEQGEIQPVEDQQEKTDQPAVSDDDSDTGVGGDDDK